MNILVYIPARGGSKGIKNKNLSKIGDKKLIDYTLNVAKNLPKYCYTFISSDNKKIRNYCQSKGFNAAYKRPSSLSTDRSSIVDGVIHALEWLQKKEHYVADAVLLLQPTSPFRNLKEVKSAITKFKQEKINSMVGVVKMKEHPRECIIVRKKSWSYFKKKSLVISRRQDYEDNYYFIDGSFYIAKTSFIKRNKTFVVENESLVYKFNADYSIDIDNMNDLRLARAVSAIY